MKIYWRLLSSFLYLSLVGILTGAISTLVLSSIRSNYLRVVEQTLPVNDSLADLKFNALRMVSFLDEWAFIGLAKYRGKNVAIQDEIETEIAETRGLLARTLERYEELVNLYFPGKRDHLILIKQKAGALMASCEAFLSAKEEGVAIDELLARAERLEVAEIAFLDVVDLALRYEDEELNKHSSEVKEAFENVILLVVVMSIVSLFSAVFMGAKISRAISGPLTAMKESAALIAAGKLDSRIEGSPIDEIGALAASLNQMNDNHQRSQRDLKETAALLLAQLDATLEGILVVDRHGKRILTNQRLLDLWQVPGSIANDSNDALLLEYVCEKVKDREPFLERVRDLNCHIHEKSRDVIEFKNGQVFDRHTAPVISKDGHYFGRIWAFRDVTDYKNSERELVEARKAAEAASKAKSEFLATVSHEIRTPMNSIVGFLALLRRTGLDKKQNEYVDIICESGDTLLKMINDVLDVSKSEADSFVIEDIDFDLRRLVEVAVKMIEVNIDPDRIALIYQIAPDLPHNYVGDPTHIKKILMNCLSNSVKFTSRGSISLHVAEDKAPRERSLEGRMISIAITDTGIGIPKEKHEEIFKPFVQADSSMTRRYGGTGLGLAIARSLARKMGGDISVESEVEKGSTFTIKLLLEEKKLLGSC